MKRALLLAACALLGCRKSHKPAAPGSGLDGSAGATARSDGGAADAAPAPAPAIDAGPTVDAALAGGFDGRPGWLVIAGNFDRHLRALARTDDLHAMGLATAVVHSDRFANLRPGWVIVVVDRFDDEAAARARVEALKPQLPEVYAKESGAIRGGGALADAGPVTVLPQLVRVFGTATHENASAAGPLLHISTPDGAFDTRPGDQGRYEFWVASAGPVSVEMNVPEHEIDCSHRNAGGYLGPRDASADVTTGGGQVQLEALERYWEGNSCD